LVPARQRRPNFQTLMISFIIKFPTERHSEVFLGATQFVRTV
jgi:hypothetical protein